MDQHRNERPASPYEKNFTLLMKKCSAPGTALGYFASSSHDMFYLLRNRLNSSGLHRSNWFPTDTGNPNRKKRGQLFEEFPWETPGGVNGSFLWSF